MTEAPLRPGTGVGRVTAYPQHRTEPSEMSAQESYVPRDIATGNRHEPALHPSGQVIPHWPQLAGSAVRSTQSPPHEDKPAWHWQLPHAHVPPHV